MGKFDDLRNSLNKSKKKFFSKSAAVGSSDSNGSGDGNGNGNGNVDHGINSGTTVVNSVDKAEEDGKIIKISSDDLQKILSTKKKMSLSSTTDSVVPMLRVRTIDSTTTPISGGHRHGSRRRYKSSASMSGSNSVTSKTEQRRKENNHSQKQTSCGSVISNISNGSGWTTLATSDTVVNTTTKQYENELSNYVGQMLFVAPIVSMFEDGLMLLGNVTEEEDDDDSRSGIDNTIKNSKSYDRSGGSDDDHGECNNSDDDDDHDDDDDDSNRSDHSGTSDTSSEDSSPTDGGCITLHIPYASSLSMSLNTIPSLLVDTIVRPRPISSSRNNYNNIGIISESTYDDDYFDDDDDDDDDVYDDESVDSMQPASAVTAQTAFEQLEQKSPMKKKSYTDTRTIPSTISNATKRSFVKDHTKDTTTSKQRGQLLLPFKNERQSHSYKRNEIAMKRISPRSSRTATATATATSTSTSKTQQLIFLSHDHDYHTLVGIDCGDECRDVINENNRDD